ncbi:hypothetical protein Tco_0805758 [Tanacetum coccineum]
MQGSKNQKTEQGKQKKTVPVETTTSNALISCDGLGDYDWSDQGQMKVQLTLHLWLTLLQVTTNSKLRPSEVLRYSSDKPKQLRRINGASNNEDYGSDSEEEDVPHAKKEMKTVKSSFAKIKFVKSKEQVKYPRKTTVKQGDQNRKNTHTPRGNQRNWNNMISQRLGSNFEMINKACYVCGSFDHLQNMVPKAVLTRSGLVSLTTARPVNTAQPKTTMNSARPMTNIFNKQDYPRVAAGVNFSRVVLRH